MIDFLEHLFIVALISLSLGIWSPVRIARAGATMQGVPTQHALDETNRRHYDKKNESQNNPRADERQHFGERHPYLVWQHECLWQDETKKHEQRADRQGNMGH